MCVCVCERGERESEGVFVRVRVSVRESVLAENIYMEKYASSQESERDHTYSYSN